MHIAIIIAGLLILMTLGTSYSWGIFLVPIVNSTGWSRAEVSLAVSILLLTFSLFMPISGFLEKKIGPSRVVEIGGILVGLGWILSSYANTPFWLYLTYGILTGIGTGFCYMPPISCGMKWFSNKKGIATGMILVGFGLGAAVFSPIIAQLITQFGWRVTMSILGIVFAIVIIILSQFLIYPPQFSTSSITGKSSDLSPMQMIKTFDFAIIFGSYFIAMFSIMLITAHLSAYITEKNFSILQGSFAITILSIFNGVGRILFGYLSDIFGTKNVLPSLFLLSGLAIANLLFSNTLLPIYLSAAFIGLGFGGFLAVYASLTSEKFGIRDFSINYGIVFIGYGLGCFLGPLLGGAIYDKLNSYQLAISITSILPLITGLFLFLKFYLENAKVKSN